jgi:hypothetical protein
MKRTLALAAGSILIAGIAGAEDLPKYGVVDLGTLPGGAFSQAASLNGRRMVAGISADKEGSSRRWSGGPCSV